jgi:hypothetical protein
LQRTLEGLDGSRDPVQLELLRKGLDGLAPSLALWLETG